jgi:hypothetical protein
VVGNKKQRLMCSICLVISSFSQWSYAGDTGDSQPVPKRFDAYGEVLFLQPYSDNLKYAVFVSGTQPYYQSWHYQAITPRYAPAFEVGLHAFFTEAQSDFSRAALSWLHLESHDNGFKQAA